jgi:hypothetical protein
MLRFLSPYRRHRLRGVTEADRLADQCQRLLDAATRARLAKLANDLQGVPHSWHYQVLQHVAFLTQTGNYRASLKCVPRRGSLPHPAADADSTLLRFCISTNFLRHECFPYLTGDPQRREVLHLVTGPITADGIRVPSRIEKVVMQDQSPAYAAADTLTTHRQMLALEEQGHALLACFHSHITHGEHSTTPSQIDIDTQNRFASIGWQAIGGIFNLDGWVRLFSTAHDFTVELYGTGAEIISSAPRETLIKLTVDA